jgi:hypothetical protein
MSVVARRIRSVPERSAVSTWEFIVDMLAPKDGKARQELQRVGGIASSIIASESPRESPIIIIGKGPRVRIYCLYDDNAVSGDNASESALAHCPTDDDWTLSLPSEADDLEWLAEALRKKSTRITVRDKAETNVDADGKAESNQSQSATTINLEAFFRS